MLGCTDTVRILITERDELVVLLRQYKLSKRSLQWKVFEQDVFIKEITGL